MEKVDIIFISFIVILAGIVGFYMFKAEFIDEQKTPEIMMSEQGLSEGEIAAGGETDLITNGRFDLNLEGWGKTGTEKNTEFSIDDLWNVCHKGAAAKIEIKNGGEAFLKQRVKLKPSSSYLFSTDVYSQSGLLSGKKADGQVTITTYTNDLRELRKIILTENENKSGTNGYCKEYNKTIQTAPEETLGEIFIGANQKGSFWFDDVSLKYQ